MKTLGGRYARANVMVDEIEQTAQDQILNFCNKPIFGKSYIAIMPDVHAGAGSVIGFTMKVNDYIVPNVVGVDIGCGMLSYKLDTLSLDLPSLDKFITNYIPHGFQLNVEPLEVSGEVAEVCSRLGLNVEKVGRSIGSLGGGNHFIELGHGEDGYLWVTIHSGSRNFGLRVAQHHQKIAKEQLKKYFIDEEYKDLEFLLLESPEGSDYMHDLGVAQRFASENRKQMMTKLLRAAYFLGGRVLHKIETVHNYIADDMIIRKGAVQANAGQRFILPFNMKDGMMICEGKGSSKYNNSAPHGAGRVMSRKKAKQALSLQDFQDSTKEIYTTTAVKSTLDEAPMAYKDKDLILNNLSETAEVIEWVKPIYNFKAV